MFFVGAHLIRERIIWFTVDLKGHFAKRMAGQTLADLVHWSRQAGAEKCVVLAVPCNNHVARM